jgi:integrase/recombinase XerC
MDFSDFKAYLQAEKRHSRHTVSAYLADLRHFSRWCAEEFALDKPENADKPVVRSFVAALVSGGWSARSVHRKVASLNAWFRYRQKNGLAQANPARGIARPKLPSRLPVVVEAARMKDNPAPVGEDLETARNNLVIRLLYETGMRRAELCGLETRSIDNQNNTVKVRGKRNRMRIIPVSQDMMRVLREFITLRDQVPGTDSHDRLLVTASGKPASEKLVYRTVTAYLSGLTTMKKKSPHVLRHSFATHMLDAGADLNAIKEILGHASLAATQVYTHNSIEKLKAVHRLHHPRNVS